MSKFLELLKRVALSAIEHPKTTALGIVGIIGGVQMIRHGNTEAGITAIFTGLGLVLASEPK